MSLLVFPLMSRKISYVMIIFFLKIRLHYNQSVHEVCHHIQRHMTPRTINLPYIATKSYLVYVTYTTAAQKPSQGRSPRNEVDTTGNP